MDVTEIASEEERKVSIRSAALCFASVMILMRNDNVISDWFAGPPYSARTKEHALRSTPGITSF